MNDNYPLLFLLFFLAGAIAALVCLKFLCSDLLKAYTVEISAVLFFANSLIASSIMAPYLLPIMSFAMGGCITLAVDSIKLAYNMGENILFQVFFFAIIVPLHFIFCSRGMKLGLCIKNSMQRKKEVYKRNLLSSYTIMLVATAVMILLAQAY